MSSAFCGRKPDSPPPDPSRIRPDPLALRSAASVHRGRIRNAEKRIHASGPAERQKTRNQFLTCMIEFAELSARYCHRSQHVRSRLILLIERPSRKRIRRIFSISSTQASPPRNRRTRKHSTRHSELTEEKPRRRREPRVEHKWLESLSSGNEK